MLASSRFSLLQDAAAAAAPPCEEASLPRQLFPPPTPKAGLGLHPPAPPSPLGLADANALCLSPPPPPRAAPADGALEADSPESIERVRAERDAAASGWAASLARARALEARLAASAAALAAAREAVAAATGEAEAVRAAVLASVAATTLPAQPHPETADLGRHPGAEPTAATPARAAPPFAADKALCGCGAAAFFAPASVWSPAAPAPRGPLEEEEERLLAAAAAAPWGGGSPFGCPPATLFVGHSDPNSDVSPPQPHGGLDPPEPRPRWTPPTRAESLERERAPSPPPSPPRAHPLAPPPSPWTAAVLRSGGSGDGSSSGGGPASPPASPRRRRLSVLLSQSGIVATVGAHPHRGEGGAAAQSPKPGDSHFLSFLPSSPGRVRVRVVSATPSPRSAGADGADGVAVSTEQPAGDGTHSAACVAAGGDAPTPAARGLAHSPAPAPAFAQRLQPPPLLLRALSSPRVGSAAFPSMMAGAGGAGAGSGASPTRGASRLARMLSSPASSGGGFPKPANKAAAEAGELRGPGTPAPATPARFPRPW